MADRIVVMNHGVIEQIGTPTEIYRHPSSLFVADFIGEMNQVEGVVVSTDTVRVGEMTLNCQPHEFAEATPIVVTVRPEDIIPHGKGARSTGGKEIFADPGNTFDVTIVEMEFLGSFWRASLGGEKLGNGLMKANFSINAIRRMGLETNGTLQIELPVDRVKIFARDS